MTRSLFSFPPSFRVRRTFHHFVQRHRSPFKDVRTTPTTLPFPRRSKGNEAIATHHLTKIYNPQNNPCVALNDVNLNIPQGTVQMVVGPSGAGKTSLLLTLSGLLVPTEGTVTLLGHSLTNLSQPHLEHFRRRYIGMVFQESNLLRSLTALENVEAMLSFRGVSHRIAHQQALQLLEDVGLSEHLHHLPRHLSGGQQQRVSVARALAGSPPIILADEPTASLDFKTGNRVVELMRQLAQDQGCTVVIATHDSRILAKSDRVVHLNDGMLQDES